MKLNLDEKAILTLSSGILAGLGTTISIAAVPAMKATSDPLPVWKQMYHKGSRVALSTIFVTTVTGIRLYLVKNDSAYLIPSGLAFAFVPFTLLAMKPTNDALNAIEDSNKGAEDARIKELLKKWANFQYVRTTLGIATFVTAVMACSKACSK